MIFYNSNIQINKNEILSSFDILVSNRTQFT